jgi:pimeloyl-ACP methyl ester carboxylesterase
MSRVELPAMELTDVGGIDLEIHDSGSGEPVAFVHAMREDWHGVLAEPALAEHHRLVYYYRRGFGRSSAGGLPLTAAQHRPVTAAR